MDTLANSEDPDEMLYIVTFHQGLHCLLRQKQFSEKYMQFYLKIIICDPLIYTMDHPKFVVQYQKKEAICAYRVKKGTTENLS